MSLEKEIKQSTFRNDYHRGFVNLIFTYNRLSTELHKLLQPHNLTYQQYNILKILKGLSPERATNGMIRERMLDKNSDVTRLVDRLIKDDLAKREHCPNDRRCVNIYITGKGLSLLGKIELLSVKMDGLLSKLSDKEVSELNYLLDKIRQ